MSKASCFVRWFDATANNVAAETYATLDLSGDFQMPSSPKAAQLEAMADLLFWALLDAPVVRRIRRDAS